MKLMMTQTLMIMILLMFMMMLNFKKKKNTKIMSPFECGYNSMMSKMPMSIQFTSLVFMFLLFDTELSILISSNWTITQMDKNWIMTMLMFLTLMMISIMYEMTKKSFKWN